MLQVTKAIQTNIAYNIFLMDGFIGIISCYIQISFLFKAINCMQAEKDAAYCSQYTLFLMSYAKSEFK